MSQELPQWLVGDTQFDERLWADDACDLANLIIDSPLGNDRSDVDGNRHMWDADWSDLNPGSLSRFTLTRFTRPDGFYFRLRVVDGISSSSIAEYVFYPENEERLSFTHERNGETTVPSLDLRQQRAEEVTRYLATAPVDHSVYFAECREMILLEAEVEVTVEDISNDQITKDEILTRPDDNTTRDPDDSFYAALEKLCLKYDIDEVIVRRGMNRCEERIEQERLEHGDA